MEQQIIDQPQQAASGQFEKENAGTPTLVIIIASLILVGGLLGLFISVPMLLIVGVSGGLMSPGQVGLGLVQNVGSVVAAIGIMRMRRWALYTYTVLIVLAAISSGYLFMNSTEYAISDFAGEIVEVVVLGYFWIISKRFV